MHFIAYVRPVVSSGGTIEEINPMGSTLKTSQLWVDLAYTWLACITCRWDSWGQGCGAPANTHIHQKQPNARPNNPRPVPCLLECKRQAEQAIHQGKLDGVNGQTG